MNKAIVLLVGVFAVWEVYADVHCEDLRQAEYQIKGFDFVAKSLDRLKDPSLKQSGQVCYHLGAMQGRVLALRRTLYALGVEDSGLFSSMYRLSIVQNQMSPYCGIGFAGLNRRLDERVLEDGSRKIREAIKEGLESIQRICPED